MVRLATVVVAFGLCAAPLAARAAAPCQALALRDVSAHCRVDRTKPSPTGRSTTYPVLVAAPVDQGGTAGASAAVRVRSLVGALHIGLLQRLPRAPATAAGEARTTCQHLLSAPQTPAGHQVADAGWAVTGEATIGPYQAVSFVGSFQQGTSGSCQFGEGNIGLFRNTELIAIAYVPAASAVGRSVASRPWRAMACVSGMAIS